VSRLDGEKTTPTSYVAGVPRTPSLTDVTGIRVGHATNRDAITGCTVVVCDLPTVAAVEVRGAAPGTRETDSLHPGGLISHIHAVLLTGGSVFGLAAAGGVERFLEERQIGYKFGNVHVPIVPAAVLYDLTIGDAMTRPDAAMGYDACSRASAEPVEEGSVGAGTGATVGKLFAQSGWMKGGIGSWSITLAGGTVVGAIAAVNALGDVVDSGGEIIAGARGPDGRFIRTVDELLSARPQSGLGTNTTLIVVATNAPLTKGEAYRLAVQGHAGLSRAILPSHTMHDGDTVFALSTGDRARGAALADHELIRINEAAAQAVSESCRRAVLAASGLGGVPAVSDLAGDR
jgi:L-aminopeptidase/D-esterase-like protein